MKTSVVSEVRSALEHRLRVVAPLLGIDDPPARTADLLHLLALTVKRSPTRHQAWLLFVAVAGSYPTRDDVDAILRELSLAADGAAILAPLIATIDAASVRGASTRRLRLVERSVLVDVNFSARHEFNTGIQRVVRRTVPQWEAAGRSFELVAWTLEGYAMRTLIGEERQRVLEWDHRSGEHREDPVQPEDPSEILLPVDCVVLMPEVPIDPLCPPLAALAADSGNRIVAVGHDAIPLVSADGQTEDESERYARYLMVIKHTSGVVAVSESAAEEFRGFVDALAAQAMTGPVVTTVPLAFEVPQSALDSLPSERQRPMVLCVGSHEPRKNQQSVLAAAELAHRGGRDFDLVFVGGGARRVTVPFEHEVRRARRAGLHVETHRRLPDARLWSLYRAARFTVFPSLHEGFGLPVAESLALGVPVLTSDFGAVAEVASRGGCITVDPRDDYRLADEMGRMLDDDGLIERLRSEASALPRRTWREYADQLWAAAMEIGPSGE